MATARYHILPEEGRPSIDSIPESESLLGPLGLSSPPIPKKPFTITYHPTFILRLVILGPLIATLVLYILSQNGFTVPAIVFLTFAILRNVLVLLQHFGEFVKIKINVEFVGREMTLGGSQGREMKKRIRHFGKRSVQVVIDLTLIAVLLITSLVAYHNLDRWFWDGQTIIPGSVNCWVALPLYLVASIDMGRPSRISMTTAITLNMGRDKDKHLPTTAVPQGAYGDVEAGFVDVDEVETRAPAQARKTRNDSP
ncbi:hypothetical protein B7463_g844, partial [Scytalidium lignicola]